MNPKNKYKVMKVIDGNLVLHSLHNNFDYAVIQRDLIRQSGVSSFIIYRNEIVEHDVKKIKIKPEGI